MFCSSSELTPLMVLRVLRKAMRARRENTAVERYISGSSAKLVRASRQLSASMPIRIATSSRTLEASRDRLMPTARLITSVSLDSRDTRSPALWWSK